MHVWTGNPYRWRWHSSRIEAYTFLTNSEPMARLLRTRCDKSHVHQALISGRCADAAFYPLPLVRTLIRGIRDTKANDAKKAQARIEKLQSLIHHPEDFNGKIIAVADTTCSARVKVNKMGGELIDLD